MMDLTKTVLDIELGSTQIKAVLIDEAHVPMQINPQKGPMQQTLLDKHYPREHGKNAYYGQNT